MNSIIQNWNDLPQIEDVHSFDQSDENCLEDIRQVLEKHDKTSKFGVALLHKHFDLGSDEILLETNNPKTKTLTIKPVNLSEIEENEEKFITTLYRFDNNLVYKCSWCKRNHHNDD